jgi:hypothetical protein
MADFLSSSVSTTDILGLGVGLVLVSAGFLLSILLLVRSVSSTLGASGFMNSII